MKSGSILVGSEADATKFIADARDVNVAMSCARSAPSRRQLVVVEHLAKWAALKALGKDKSSNI